MFLAAAIAGFIAGAGLIIAIGSKDAFVLRHGLLRRIVGLVVATCALGGIALIICGVAGVGALVREWSALLQALRFGGAAFLAMYGLLAAHRAWNGSAGLSSSAAANTPWRSVLLACLAFTLLNPHVHLDTMVLSGSLSTRYSSYVQWGFTVGACLASVSWFTTLGFGSRLLLPVFRSQKAWRLHDVGVASLMLTLVSLLVMRPLN